ncbi:MAG: translational GTPase TypA [Bdellovibrionales bacterium]|nr:translational GTPase TypA [Bdellovibrionales bacterium]
MQMPIPIRNIDIIAHEKKRKTTLVDHLLKQSGTFRENYEVADRLMDSMDLEKERGITIAAKNASFAYRDIKVNIVDTPGHSDFGGEVERILDMVDGAILLVDASEGPLPQTRFVLHKALQKNIKILVCINKIDRPDSRIDEVLNEIFDLFIDLDANEEQADFTTIYAIAKDGIAVMDPKQEGKDLKVLLDWIVDEFPPPVAKPEEALQMLVTNIDYDDYVGRLAIGRIRAGKIKLGDEILVCRENGNKKVKVTQLFHFHTNNKVKVEEISAGDIAIVAGFSEISIGDSLTSVENPRPLERILVDEPTVAVELSVNDSPFSGLEGKQVTSRKIKERLERELLYNVAIRVEDTDKTDTWKVIGRGELQLSVLFEQMRREGFEFLVSKPQVLLKTENGKKFEPMENAVVDVEEAYLGAVTQKLGERKGVLVNIENKGSGRTRAEFKIPSRGLIGYRSEFLTDTRGTGLLNTYFAGYEEYKGAISGRNTGSIISDRQGVATPYAIFALEDRGRMFITPGTKVYAGMVIGEANKGIDLNVNITKEKKLTNVRASGSDEAIKLTPVKPLNLEQALEWISESELIEITPQNIRLRCKELDMNKRKAEEKKLKSLE